MNPSCERLRCSLDARPAVGMAMLSQVDLFHDCFDRVDDARVVGRTKHLLHSIPFLVSSALIADADGPLLNSSVWCRSDIVRISRVVIAGAFLCKSSSRVGQPFQESTALISLVGDSVKPSQFGMGVVHIASINRGEDRGHKLLGRSRVANGITERGAEGSRTVSKYPHHGRKEGTSDSSQVRLIGRFADQPENAERQNGEQDYDGNGCTSANADKVMDDVVAANDLPLQQIQLGDSHASDCSPLV